MPCYHVKLPGGGTAIVKVGNAPGRKCSVCGTKTRNYRLCDFPVGNGKTCSAVLCQLHGVHVEPDSDFCPPHQAAGAGGRLKL
ncbi:MAG TPA: hypothetical protein VGL72_14000 [Bryobacteraceae bacterium]